SCSEIKSRGGTYAWTRSITESQQLGPLGKRGRERDGELHYPCGHRESRPAGKKGERLLLQYPTRSERAGLPDADTGATVHGDLERASQRSGTARLRHRQ